MQRREYSEDVEQVRPCVKCGSTVRSGSGRCAPCNRKTAKEWRKANPEKKRVHGAAYRKKNGDRLGEYHREYYREYYREQNLIKKYGITIEAWNELLRSQNFCCALCHEPFDLANTKDMHTDHCHVTGLVRGILHLKCNAVLGMAEDSPARLEAAALYLRMKGKTA